MLEKKFEVEFAELGSSLRAHARSCRWQGAMSILSTAARLGHLDAVLCSMAVSGFARADDWQRALQTLALAGGMVQSDLVLVNSVLPSFKKTGSWSWALQLRRGMRSCGLQPDTATYNGCLASCRMVQAWIEASSMFIDAAVVNIQLDIISCNALASTNEGERWSHCFSLLSQTQRANMQPDLHTCNSVIAACEKSWKHALIVQSTGCFLGSRSDSITFGAGINACAKGSQWLLAVSCLRQMDDRRMSNGVAYSAAVHACDACAQWACALDLLDDLMDSEIQDSSARNEAS